MPTTLREVVAQIKTAGTEAERVVAVKKLYAHINSEELYDKHSQIIQLLFDFVGTSDDPDLVLESLFFLTNAYKIPHERLAALTAEMRYFQKFEKTLDDPVFEARVLNFRTGLEVFCYLFVLISELIYFQDGFLSPALIRFVQRYCNFQNAKIRRFSRSALCGILQFRREWDSALCSQVYSFVQPQEEPAVLIAATQALSAHSVLADFQFSLPFEPLFETFGALAQRDQTPEIERACQDILKFLVNLSTSENCIARLCQTSFVYAVSDVFGVVGGLRHAQKALIYVLANMTSVETGARAVAQNRQMIALVLRALDDEVTAADAVDILSNMFYHKVITLTRDIARALNGVLMRTQNARMTALLALLQSDKNVDPEIMQQLTQ